MKMKFKRAVAFMLTLLMTFSTVGTDLMTVYASSVPMEDATPGDTSAPQDTQQSDTTVPTETQATTDTTQTTAPTDTTAQSTTTDTTPQSTESADTTAPPSTEQSDTTAPADTTGNSTNEPEGNPDDSSEPQSATSESTADPAVDDTEASFDLEFKLVGGTATKIKIEDIDFTDLIYTTTENSVKLVIAPEDGYEFDMDATAQANPTVNIQPTNIENEYVVSNITSNVTIHIHMKLLPEEDGDDPDGNDSAPEETETTETKESESETESTSASNDLPSNDAYDDQATAGNGANSITIDGGSVGDGSTIYVGQEVTLTSDLDGTIIYSHS